MKSSKRRSLGARLFHALFGDPHPLSVPTTPMRPVELLHPHFGKLWSFDPTRRWETEVEFPSYDRISFYIHVRVDSSESDREKLFAGAADFLEWARRNEPACRERIADEYLDEYNQSAKKRSIPFFDRDSYVPLDRPEYMTWLTLSWISLDETDAAGWVYHSRLYPRFRFEVEMNADREITRVEFLPE